MFSGIAVCSVCHNPHSQASAAWDLFAGPYTGLKGGDSGAASAAGTLTTIIDSSKAAFWTANAWQNYYVRILSSSTTSNVGQVRLVSANTTTQLTLSSAYPAAVQSGDKYEIVGRHFQITADDVNQMCEACHYYRVQNHTRVEGGDPAYPANGTNVSGTAVTFRWDASPGATKYFLIVSTNPGLTVTQNNSGVTKDCSDSKGGTD